MPYKSLNDLPDNVKNHLPTHGQEIYLSAYNNAWDEYKEPEERRSTEDDRETVAHKVAWAAVKKKYEKRGDDWVEKKH